MPNFLIVAGLGALYVHFGVLQPVTAIFYGVSPVVIALILHSCYRLAKLGMQEHGWLGEREFLIAVAIGMISPGPVVITATFVGYLVAGFWGALTATIGIFLPSFLLGAVKPISHRLNEVYIMKKNTILALFTPCCGGDPC